MRTQEEIRKQQRETDITLVIMLVAVVALIVIFGVDYTDIPDYRASK